MTTILSRPKEKIKILLLEGISEMAVAALSTAGYANVDLRKVSLEGEELRAALDGVSFSNTRSVAELTIAEIVMLFRHIFPKSAAAHAGGWLKSAAGSHEVRGKTLGIIGYGNIGSQLSGLAEAMGAGHSAALEATAAADRSYCACFAAALERRSRNRLSCRLMAATFDASAP